MRLDKFLTETGMGTRNQVKTYIRQRKVTVNGAVVLRPELHIDPDLDAVCLEGTKVNYEAFQYFMMYKPAGVLTATEDKRQKTVFDLLREPYRSDLFPVGRLDKDTEGLLLITNDGELAHRLLSPKKHVGKCYFAVVEGSVTEEHAAIFRQGFALKDGTTVQPSILTITKPFNGKDTQVKLMIYEGKFHQVKRMFETFGGTVVYLKRLSFGPLTLDEEHLKPGEYRELTQEERELLYNGKQNS